MARVNIVKQIKVGGKWALRSIPKKASSHYNWNALPDGTYFIEWRENGQRKREPAGVTASQALEAQRKRRHELEGGSWNAKPSTTEAQAEATTNSPLQVLIDRYLGQIETLKKTEHAPKVRMCPAAIRRAFRRAKTHRYQHRRTE